MEDERQHFVARNYLSRFCYQKNSSFQWLLGKLPRPLVTPVNVKDTCILHDFYDLSEESMEKFGEREADILERRAFRDYEMGLNAVFNRFVSRQCYISDADWDFVCNGYIVQKYRTRSFQEKAGDAKRLGESFEYSMGRFGLSFGEDDRRTFIEQMRIGYRDFHIENIYTHFRGQNQIVNNAINTLRRYSLDVIEAPPEHFFCTSDNPGFSIAVNDSGQKKPTNLELDYAHSIIFPISSRQALKFHTVHRPNVLKNVLRPVRYITANLLDMQDINAATLHVAHEKVFCENRTYLDGCAKYFDQFLEMSEKRAE